MVRSSFQFFLLLLLLLLISVSSTSARHSTAAAASPEQDEDLEQQQLDDEGVHDHEAVDDPRYDPKLNEALDQFMDLVAQHRVVIVGKKGCSFTDKAKSVFAELKEKPHIIDLLALRPDEETLVLDALKRWLGYWVTPQIFVHGMHYGGAELLLDNYKNGHLVKDLHEMKTEL